MNVKPGDVIAGYRVERILGVGGMGAVVLGVDERGVRRAIKLPIFEGESAAELRLRFAREAQTLARLKPHRNIVSVHAAGLDGERPFCVLDLVDGKGADDLVQDGPLPLERALALAHDVACALEHVHAAGLVHRDVKPANVLVRTEDGSGVLTDFGLVKDEKSALTTSGVLLGTVYYMAPEQAGAAAQADARADVYGLAATLFHFATGRPPFRGTLHEALRKLATEDPPAPSSVARGLTRDVDRVLLRALAKAPEDRHPSMRELRLDLERLQRGEPIAKRSTARRSLRWVALPLGAVVVAAAAAFFALRPPAASSGALALGPAEWRIRAGAARHALADERRGLEPGLLGLAAVDTSALGRFERASRELDGLLAKMPAGLVASDEAATAADARAERALLHGLEAVARDGRAPAAALDPLVATEPASEPVLLEAVAGSLRLLLAAPADEQAKGLATLEAWRSARSFTDRIEPDAAPSRAVLAVLGALDERAKALAASSDPLPTALLELRARALVATDPSSSDDLRAVAAFVARARSRGARDLELVARALVRQAASSAPRVPTRVADALEARDREALARALAALVTRDPDALGAVFPADLGPFFSRLALALVDADSLREGLRLATFAILASPPLEADFMTLPPRLRDAASAATQRGDHEGVVGAYTDALRMGFPLGGFVDARGVAIEEARLVVSPRDVALRLRLAIDLDAAADRAAKPEEKRAFARRGLALALAVTEDPLAPRSLRSRAFETAAWHEFTLGDRAAEQRYYELAHEDSSMREWVSTVVARTALERWLASSPTDPALLATARTWGQRAVDEARAHIERNHEMRLLPAEGGVVPQRRLSVDDEVDLAAIRQLVPILVATGEQDEALALLDHRPAGAKDQRQHDALLRAFIAYSKGQRPALGELSALLHFNRQPDWNMTWVLRRIGRTADADAFEAAVEAAAKR